MAMPVLPAEVPDQSEDQSEADREIRESLLTAHTDFNHRFPTKLGGEGIKQSFYHSEEWQVPVLQRNIPVEDGLQIILREPAIIGDAGDYEPEGEESDEPEPSGLPFVFEISLVRKLGEVNIPDWTLLLHKDGSYEASSILGLSAEQVAEEAIRELHNLEA